MNPPEKYVFNSTKRQEIRLLIPQRHLGMLAKESDIVYPYPQIIAIYKLIGETYNGFIYEYDGLEVR